MSKTRIHIPLKHITNSRIKNDNCRENDKQILTKSSRDVYRKTTNHKETEKSTEKMVKGSYYKEYQKHESLTKAKHYANSLDRKSYTYDKNKVIISTNKTFSINPNNKENNLLSTKKKTVYNFNNDITTDCIDGFSHNVYKSKCVSSQKTDDKKFYKVHILQKNENCNKIEHSNNKYTRSQTALNKIINITKFQYEISCNLKNVAKNLKSIDEALFEKSYSESSKHRNNSQDASHNINRHSKNTSIEINKQRLSEKLTNNNRNSKEKLRKSLDSKEAQIASPEFRCVKQNDENKLQLNSKKSTKRLTKTITENTIRNQVSRDTTPNNIKETFSKNSLKNLKQNTLTPVPEAKLKMIEKKTSLSSIPNKNTSHKQLHDFRSSLKNENIKYDTAERNSINKFKAARMKRKAYQCNPDDADSLELSLKKIHVTQNRVSKKVELLKKFIEKKSNTNTSLTNTLYDFNNNMIIDDNSMALSNNQSPNNLNNDPTVLNFSNYFASAEKSKKFDEMIKNHFYNVTYPLKLDNINVESNDFKNSSAKIDLANISEINLLSQAINNKSADLNGSWNLSDDRVTLGQTFEETTKFALNENMINKFNNTDANINLKEIEECKNIDNGTKPIKSLYKNGNTPGYFSSTMLEQGKNKDFKENFGRIDKKLHKTNFVNANLKIDSKNKLKPVENYIESEFYLTARSSGNKVENKSKKTV